MKSRRCAESHCSAHDHRPIRFDCIVRHAASLLMCCLLAGSAALAAQNVNSQARGGAFVAQRAGAEGHELLFFLSGTVGETEVDEVRFTLPRGLRKQLDVRSLGDGWEFSWDKGTGVLRGSDLGAGLALGLVSKKPFDLGAVDVEWFGGGDRLAKQAAPVVEMPRLGTSQRAKDLVSLPNTVRAGDFVEFRPIQPDRTPVGGVWTINGVPAEWNGSFVDPVYFWDAGFGEIDSPVSVTFSDPWGHTLMEGEFDIAVDPGVADPQPWLVGCSPKVLTGGVLCVCGNFPDAASRSGLLIDGKPLGPPLSSSSTALTFRLPAGLPPGPFVITGDRAAGYGPDDHATGVHIAVSGEIDRSKLLRGESTTLRLFIQGTEEPVSLRLWNETPNIISLDGGEDQVVTTSGGPSNEVVRRVDAVSVGDFHLAYELTISTCPCVPSPEPVEPTSVLVPPTAPFDPPRTAEDDRRERCAETAAECQELIAAAEQLEAAARDARRTANRIARSARLAQLEADNLRDRAQIDLANADKARRRVGDLIALAESNEQNARENRRRDAELPGKGYDESAAVAEQAAAELRQRAEAEERLADELQRRAEAQLEAAAEWEARIQEAEAADQAALAAEAEASAARARAEACLERFTELCPEFELDGTRVGYPGGEPWSDPPVPPGGAPPPEEDEEDGCPQRDGKHPACVALVIDYLKESESNMRDVDETHAALQQMGCDIDYAAPHFFSLPPKKVWVEQSTWNESDKRFEESRVEIGNTQARAEVLQWNQAQKAIVDAAIESHRAKLRRGAILGMQVIYAHGDDIHPCGSYSTAVDYGSSFIDRDEFYEGNYEAAYGNVCAWYTADFSCRSYLGARLFDNLNNQGRAVCSGPLYDDPAFHAGYEANIVHACATQGTITKYCFPRGDVNYLEDDIDDVLEGLPPASTVDPKTAYQDAYEDLLDASDTLFLSFSAYGDQGREQCQGTHTRRGPYWQD